MSSKGQTQYGKGTSGKEKSAGKGKKSNQPLYNDECCNTNAELAAPKEELISRKNKPPRSLWFIVRIFVIYANNEDLTWIHNLIKGFENNYERNVFSISADVYKRNEDEYMAKNMLMMKLKAVDLSPIVQPSAKSFSFKDLDGKELIISRETVKLNLTEIYSKPVTEPLSLNTLNPSKIISYEFIARLIHWDVAFSHLRGISPTQIYDYVYKCREEGCLEKAKIEINKLDKKILSYKKRGKYTQKNQKKIALKYRTCENIRLILEKFNYYVLERHYPYFMYH